MQAFFLNFLSEATIALLFFTSYLAISTYLKQRTPQFYSPALAYAVFWILNILVFFLAIRWHLPYLSLVVLGPGVIFYFISLKNLQRRHLWYLLIIPALFVLWCLPISEADSIGYHIPKADQAITQNTFPEISTSNTRAAYRFWGIEAQVGNLLLLTYRNTHILEIVSVLSLFVLYLQLVAILATVTQYPKLIALLACSLPPLLLVVTTIKPDIAVITFLLGIYSQIKNKPFMFWASLLLSVSIVSSKATYTILLATLFLTLLTIPPLRNQLLRLTKEGITTALALLTVVLFHWKSVLMWNQLDGVSAFDKLKGIISGLAPSEVVRILSNEKIYHWNDVFKELIDTQLRSAFFSLSYHDPSYLTTVVICFIGFIIGLKHQPRLIGFCTILILLVLSLFSNPDVSFFRYLQPAFVILACIGGVWLAKKTYGVWCIRVLITLSIISLFNAHIVPNTLSKAIALKRPPYLIEMSIWNTHLLPIPEFTPVHGQILSVANYHGGLSGEYIFTDSNKSTILHLFPELLSLEEKHFPPHDYILISGTYSTDNEAVLDFVKGQKEQMKLKNYEKLEIIPNNVILFRPKVKSIDK